MSDVREALSSTICILQQASAADMAGDVDAALLLYVSAAARFEQLVQIIPTEHAEVVSHHIQNIRQRAEDLRTDKTRKSVVNDYPKFPVQFHNQAIPLDDRRHAIPHATILRPYWLMRTLSKSIQQGAFITPDLYVSKDVWYQDGATTVVTYIGPKVRFLSNFCDAIEPLQQVTSLGDAKKVLKVLDQFLRVGEELKNVFDADVGKAKGSDAIAQRSKIERGVWEFIHKGQTMLKSWKVQQDATYNSYVVWSVNVLEQTQLLDRWTQYFLQAEGGAGHNEVLERLHQVSALLYFSVCSFLVQDMMLLTERFLEKSRESVSRFLPVEVKFED